MAKRRVSDCRQLNKLLGDGKTSAPPSPEAQLARTFLSQRRQREAEFGDELFGEPAWDMLLTLFVAQEEGRHLTVSSLCFQTPVPVTTAHRWMLALMSKGLLVRIGDQLDRRRSYVYLSADAARRTRRLLRRMLPHTGE